MKKTLFAMVGFGAAASVLAFGVNSGLNKGESVSAFHPMHVAGPDKGTDTCPPCKYGARPAVQVWFNGESEENMMKIAKAINAEVSSSKKDLKGFVINLTMCDACVDATKTVGAKAEKAGINKVGFTYLSNKDAAVKAYKVNTAAEVKNTVFVYKNKQVVEKFVNMKADAAGLKALKAALDKVQA